MPHARVFIECGLIWPKRQLVVYKDEKGYPSMELHSEIKGRESHRNGFLDSIDTSEWPPPMILGRLVAKFPPFLFPRKHTFISTITAAVPLFPPHIKWLLQIPWAINGVSIRGKIAVLKAFVPHTSSLLTLLNTSLVNRISVTRARAEDSEKTVKCQQEKTEATLCHQIREQERSKSQKGEKVLKDLLRFSTKHRESSLIDQFPIKLTNLTPDFINVRINVDFCGFFWV